jgi:hypothetical protein
MAQGSIKSMEYSLVFSFYCLHECRRVSRPRAGTRGYVCRPCRALKRETTNIRSSANKIRQDQKAHYPLKRKPPQKFPFETASIRNLFPVIHPVLQKEF